MFSALIAASLYRGSKKAFFCHVREIPGSRSIFIFKALLRLSGARLIFNSKATKDAFNLEGEVIYNGVEEISSPATTSQENHKIKILLIGRINTWKGQVLFLDSLASLSSEHLSKLDVRIVGSAFEGYEYLEAELHQKIKVSALHEIVTLIPFSADPTEHFTWADYVVVPSIKPEPFGRVAIEAFSMGLPVIAAGHGGLVEIVCHSKNGFIFEPSSPIALSEALKSLPHPSSDNYRNLSVGAVSTYRAKFSLSQYAENIAKTVLNRTNED
jgi:glycosyltransferase involved in cell wall biosynthesis